MIQAQPIKVFWFDTETTGLDPAKNDIIQLAGKILEGQKVLAEFDLTCQPFSYEHVDAEALAVNQRTMAEIQTFEPPAEMYRELSLIFNAVVDKFDKGDKLVPAGQNVRFDINFLAEFWKKNNDNYLFSYLGPACFDTMQLAVMYEMTLGHKLFSSYKLGVVYQQLFGMEMVDAHDAMADIDATIAVARRLWSLIRGQR